MKRKRIITQFLLYVLMFMFLIVAGCSDGDDDDDDNNQNQQDLFITVSGTVTDGTGAGVQGVNISAMYSLTILNVKIWEGSISSDLFSYIMTGADGSYTLTLPAALVEQYNVVLTPAKKGYTFTPARRTFDVGLTDITGVNFTAVESSVYGQADLAGTWRMNLLRTGTENMWTRARVTIGATGVAQCLSYETSASAGDTTCPADFDLTFTVNEDTGAIIQSGAYAPGDGGHMTMNSDKDFAAGTATAGTNNQIVIAQKEGTTNYSNANLASHNFVVHGLVVGQTNEWWYGAGATDSALGVTMDEEIGPTGAPSATINGVTLAVAVDGTVTLVDALGARASDFEGFLSVDKKTVVGTYTDINGDYQLMVVQVTDGQAVANMTGSSYNHLLGVGDDILWAHHDINVSRFETSFLPDILELTFALDVMLSYNWNLSLAYTPVQRLALVSVKKLNIAPNGQATVTNPETDAIVFHGQLAFDGTFMVGTETMDLTEGTIYTLNVITH
ncbi:MAG TPA: carboxypeptidase-like regulatory domain-containing protein [Smithella sp.]|nr:carboxypeptidase-like regulatory domain-containing protein [Smithella sp.]